MVALYAEIQGPFDSRELFELLSEFGKVNVTDMGDIVLVYGELPVISAAIMLSFCSDYGDIIKSRIDKL